jgi:putative Holliday junction resolvase
MFTPRIADSRTSAATRSESRRILAIDYGRKRIGMALSDDLGMTARPLGILVRTNRRDDLRRLRGICREHGVALIIVGHPVHMTGEASEMSDEAARFGARVKKELGIETELYDERLTSWEAQQMVSGEDSHSRRKGSLDDLAAAILLRDYLERKRSEAPASTEEKA